MSEPLTRQQMLDARRLLREQVAQARAEQAFRARLLETLTEGQNAINIAFGAILSAYVGNMLTGIDDKRFDGWALAFFFVLIGVTICGLCVGNSVLLRRHFGLGVALLGVGGGAGWAVLRCASSLGFELPILRILFLCWVGMLIATDALLTFIVFLHHHGVT